MITTQAPPAGTLAPNQFSVTPGPDMIDIAQVQGKVHAQSIHRVGELAENNPNETVSVIRQWMAEPA